MTPLPKPNSWGALFDGFPLVAHYEKQMSVLIIAISILSFLFFAAPAESRAEIVKSTEPSFVQVTRSSSILDFDTHCSDTSRFHHKSDI